jgi:DNA polymerase elongation subunit (family B)
VVLDRARIAELMEREPERVREYALQDVRESRALAELVFPADFYLAQMAPDDLETIATSGTGEKIDALMVRAALRAGRGIPLPEPPRASPGGLTELREAGVIRRVAKADVESLYPSLMLTYDIRPARDELGVFLPMLRSLTERRLDAKARASEPGPRRAYWNGLQSSFKILINSFYGYLGGPFHFNDHDAAAEVTRRGRELVAGVARRLTETGSRVIEIDTDGIYFVPPLEAATAEDEDAYVARLAAELPDGIRLVHEARYAVMISLKVKNYALIGYDGRRVLHGASLRSRADEPYGRDFLSRAIDRLADDDLDGLARLYQETIEAILDGRVPIRDLARRERVTEKTLTSDARRRSRDAAGAAPEGSLMTVYERRDGTLGRIEQYAGDEDRVHYVEKLHRFAARLEPALGDRFQTVFPRPDTRRIQAEVGGQLRLF